VAEFDIMYDEGISRAGDLLDMAVEMGVIEKRGSYYYREGESLAQGRENAKRLLREQPEIAGQIETTVRDHLALKNDPPLTTGDEGFQVLDEHEAQGAEAPLSALELAVEDVAVGA
jgi:recombination protein RecA